MFRKISQVIVTIGSMNGYEAFYNYLPAGIFLIFIIFIILLAIKEYRNQKKVGNFIIVDLPIKVCITLLFGLPIDDEILAKLKLKTTKNNENVESSVERVISPISRFDALYLYYQAFVHFMISINALTILFLESCFIEEQTSNKCIQSNGFKCYAYDDDRIAAKCEIYEKSNSTETNVLCESFGFKSFSDTIKSFGAYAGLITAFLTIHRISIKIFIMQKKKLHSKKFIKVIFTKLKKSSCFIGFERLILILTIIIDFFVLAADIIIHGMPHVINYKTEQYIFYSCSAVSVYFMCLSIDRTYFKIKNDFIYSVDKLPDNNEGPKNSTLKTLGKNFMDSIKF